MEIKPILLALSVIILSFFGNSACDVQRTAREKISLQYNSDRQNKYAELNPAEGTFSGLMHLKASDQNFLCLLTLQRVSIIERAPQSQNPSETIEVPKLSGSMTFPALANMDIQDYGNFQELLSPLGGNMRVLIDYGDYSPMSQNLILPYSIPGYAQTYGEISGRIVNNHFIGTWFSSPLGEVGTFDIVRTPLTGVKP